jgi:hypothetical protein
MTSRRNPARSTALLLTLIAVVVWPIAPATAAFGGCSINPHDAVGGREPNTTTRLGNKANVLVNNFTQQQQNTFRSVTIWQSNSFSAEVGWFVNPSVTPLPRAYKTWVNDGFGFTVNGTQNIFPLGEAHEFKVHDQNHDRMWSFAWDGNALGNQTVNFDWGFPLDQSERCNTPDNLFAHFSSLQRITAPNASWTNYSDVVQYIDNTSAFAFCRASATDFSVKAAC